MRKELWVWSLGLVLRASGVCAQGGSDTLVRRELLNEAEAARNLNDHERALDRAQRAMQIRATPSVGLFIAQEAETLCAQPGRERLCLVALSRAVDCAALASADPQLNNREVVLQRCREVAVHMRARVGRVRLTLRGEVRPGLTVRVNGEVVPQVAWGTDYPVVAGGVRVEATTSDGQTFHTEVRVGTGVVVPVVVEVPPPATPATPEQITRAARLGLSPPRPAPARASNLPAWGLIVGGAALALTGGVFLGLRFSAAGERVGLCPDDGRGGGMCPNVDAYDRAVEAYSSERTFSTMGFVLMGTGIAAALSGEIWRRVNDRSTSQSHRGSTRRPWRWGFTTWSTGVMGTMETSL